MWTSCLFLFSSCSKTPILLKFSTPLILPIPISTANCYIIQYHSFSWSFNIFVTNSFMHHGNNTYNITLQFVFVLFFFFCEKEKSLSLSFFFANLPVCFLIKVFRSFEFNDLKIPSCYLLVSICLVLFFNISNLFLPFLVYFSQLSIKNRLSFQWLPNITFLPLTTITPFLWFYENFLNNNI